MINLIFSENVFAGDYAQVKLYKYRDWYLDFSNLCIGGNVNVAENPTGHLIAMTCENPPDTGFIMDKKKVAVGLMRL